MKKRTIGIIVGLLTVVVILFFVWPRESISSTPEVKTTSVTQQDFKDVISTVGIIEPTQTESLTGQGLVAEVNVEENSTVEEDEVLVTYVDGTQLIAPFAGTIVELNVRTEEMDTNAQQNQSSLILADLEDLEVVIELSKNEASHVAIDQNAELTYLEETYQGVVSSIDTIASSNPKNSSLLQSAQNSPTLNATISFETDDTSALIPGFDIDVNIITQTTKDALAIPIESVLYDQDGNPYVFIIEDDIAHKRKIETGIQEGVMIEVVSGLVVSEEVVQLPDENLSDGDEVIVQNDDNRNE